MVVFTRRRSCVALVASILLAAGASVAAAQTVQPDPAFARMGEKLKSGDRLRIALVDGTTITGRLDELAADRLIVVSQTGTRRLDAGDVAKVQRTRRGYVLGTLIGAGVGVACGAALASYAENEGGSQAAAFLGPAAIGTGIGFAIDAFVNFPRTVYRRPPPAASLLIDAGPGRTAIGVTLRF